MREIGLRLTQTLFSPLTFPTLCFQRLVGALEFFNYNIPFRSSRARLSDSVALLCAALNDATKTVDTRKITRRGISPGFASNE